MGDGHPPLVPHGRAAARRAQPAAAAVGGGRVRVRAAKLPLLGSDNLAVVCPGPKLARRGLAFTAPLAVRSVFQER